METKRTYKLLANRTAVAIAFIGLIGAAQADLKMSVTVSASGSGIAGVAPAGIYEVDYRKDFARVVTPNGMIALFDFTTSQVAMIDPGKKSYSLQPLSSLLKPRSGSTLTATLSADSSTASQKLFGTTAMKFFVAAQGAEASSAKPLPRSKQKGSNGISGSTWAADGTSVKSILGSSAPLILIGAPRELAQSLTDSFDRNSVIPLFFSFTSSNGVVVNGSVDMTVDSILTVSMDDSLYSVPSGYELVGKKESK